MSIHLISLVLSRKVGSPTRKLILLKLADCASDDGGQAYPSLNRVADETETSRGTVKRTIRALIADGLLSLDYHGGGHQGSTNVYRLNLEAIKALEPSRSTGAKANRVQNEPGSQWTGGWAHSGPRGGLTVTPEPSFEPSIEPSFNPPSSPPTQDTLDLEAQCDDPDDDATASASDHDPATSEAAEPGGADAGGGGTARGRRSGGSGGGAADRKPVAKSPSRRRQFPEDWWPTDAGCAYAEQQGCPDLDANVAACIDFHRSRGNTFADLDAAWRTWCRNACKYGWAGSDGGQAAAYGGRGGGYSNAGDRARQATDRMSRAAAEIAAEWDERDRAGTDPGGSGAVPVVDLAAYRDGGSGGW